jgi:Nodulation protein S (NodS)
VKGRLGREYFEGLYAESNDPWNFETSGYERNKYRRTLEVLGERHFQRALEAGASIGVFTEMLAGRCDELLAVAVSERAVVAARERLSGLKHLVVERRTLPEEMPGGPFDLIVASEIPYFLEGPGEGSGSARRVGMDAACACLLQVGRPKGIIACTDADTVVAPDWLAAQLRGVSEGARAIGGRIELADDGSLSEHVRCRHAEAGRRRHEHLREEREQG